MSQTQVVTQESRVIPGPNGGAIRTGGNPGNKGGSGRPSHEAQRLAWNQVFKPNEAGRSAADYMGSIARGEFDATSNRTPTMSESIAAFGRLASILPQIQIVHSADVSARAIISALPGVLGRFLEPAQCVELLSLLRDAVKDQVEPDVF